jgi:hypothetical protein
MKVSFAKQSPHTAKSHGLSLQFIQMELSGFNMEPKRNDLVSGEYNHLQMIFYKLGKNMYNMTISSSNLSPTLRKILRFFNSNTILTTSFMTSRIVTINFFPFQGFSSALLSCLTASFVWASVIGHGNKVGNIAR